MRTALTTLCVLLAAGVLPAQLTLDQRVLDFQNLAAMYAKRYAPYEWKKQALGFDLYNITPFLDRVRAARNDLEFFEIEADYVARMQDTHSYFRMTSNFAATLGITLDIYDGKVLIDSIARTRLPQAEYPFAIGDEVVSVDGVPVNDLIERFSKYRYFGNPVTTRRNAAGMIAVRSQVINPRAVELGDSAKVVIRDSRGDETVYTLPWVKSGVPVTKVGPVPMPRMAPRTATLAAEETPDYFRPLEWLRNYRLPEDDPIVQPVGWGSDTSTGEPRKFVLGQGSRAPVFSAAFPSSFIQRLGKVAADFHYSGTYKSGDLTIGYIRIPGFGPANTKNAIQELDTEIAYMQDNTDGLVIDVMRNNGGGCYMLDAAARLIPYPFYFFGQELRATQDLLNAYQATVNSLRAANAPQWVITTYQSHTDQIAEALAQNRGMTGMIAACSQYESGWAPVLENNPPADVVYRKPLIILVDEWSISAADIFPAMLQDNTRGVLVGMRTSGGGGSTSSWHVGYYSESLASNTNSLVVRNHTVITPDLPPAPYVENIGTRPDVELNYMTRENLLNGGRTFVNQFTQIIVDQVRK